MGGSFSKRQRSSRYPSDASGSYSWGYQGYPQPPYMPPNHEYGQPQYASTPQSYGEVHAPESKRRLERKYSKIDDNYNSLEQVRQCFLFCNNWTGVITEDHYSNRAILDSWSIMIFKNNINLNISSSCAWVCKFSSLACGFIFIHIISVSSIEFHSIMKIDWRDTSMSKSYVVTSIFKVFDSLYVLLSCSALI